MIEQRIRARYRVETPLPAAEAAGTIAGEQSTGTLTRIPGETDELRELHGARVESVVAAEAIPMVRVVESFSQSTT